MPKGPAARVTDKVIHPIGGVLNPGPGSPNVLIGSLPAWRGVPAAAAQMIQSAKKVSDQTITVAEAATTAAMGTPGAPAAKAAEQTVKSTAAATMGSLISGAAGGADIHVCNTPLPVPPHGPGVVVDGSPTVLINGLPACRQGDTIVEAVGPPDRILLGWQTVIIGNSAGGAPVAGQAFYATPEDAARAALSVANPQSINANSEFGGMIFQGPNGQYGFTGPGGGSGAAFNPSTTPVPPGTTAVGDYHTHGDYSTADAHGNPVRTSDPSQDQFGSDDFSAQDRTGIAQDAAHNGPGYKGYLGTPSGGFKQYDPATGRTSAL